MPNPFPFALRVWNTGVNKCPPEISQVTPPGYENGCVAVVIGGTSIDWVDNVNEWLDMRMGELQERLGFSDEAAETVCIRYAVSFLWTIFYDPTGTATPAPKYPTPM